MTFDDVTFVALVFPLFGVVLWFVPYLILSTKDRRNDPYRFCKKLVTSYALIDSKKFSLEEMKVSLKEKLSIAATINSGTLTFHFAFPKESSSRYEADETRLVTMTFDENRKTLKVSVEPENSFRLIDSLGKNFEVLAILERQIEWLNKKLPLTETNQH